VSETRSEPVQSLLDDIGARHGLELPSLSRDVLRTWERFLAPLRDQSFDPLQIGSGPEPIPKGLNHFPQPVLGSPTTTADSIPLPP
jgi:hypothetical protein